MAQTTGEARAKLVSLRRAARAKSLSKRMGDFRGDDQTENDLVMLGFDDGWSAGYRAGYQQALDNMRDVLGDAIKAQRSGIMAAGLD